MLPSATLMSSCAQLGCEEAKGWAGRCPDRQMQALRCPKLRWPLPFPVHTHGDWGGVGGGAVGRSRSLLRLGVPGLASCQPGAARVVGAAFLAAAFLVAIVVVVAAGAPSLPG